MLRDKAYEEPLETLVAYLVDSFELLPYLDKISKTTAEFEERKANVRELQSATQRYANAGPSLPQRGDSENGAEMETPLGEYLDDVALVTDMADQARESQDKRFKVCLMTIHGSKGMEFDTVFVVGNEDGTLPTIQAIMEGEGSVVLEEEKRLCYVAMTRAKTELFLTWRKEVPIFTTDGIKKVAKKRSRFLDVLVAKKGGSNGSESTSGNPGPTKSRKKTTKQSGTNAVFSKTKSFQHNEREPREEIRQTISSVAPRRSSPAPYQRNQYSNHDSTNSNRRRPSWGQDRSQSLRSSRPKPTGTQSVYAKQRPNAFDPPLERASPPWTAPKPQPVSPPPKKKNVPTSKPRTQEKMDSTWFFPVGSKVKHSKFGEGVVLRPPEPREDCDMPVLVKFPDGERREFSARGTDLSPVLF